MYSYKFTIHFLKKVVDTMGFYITFTQILFQLIINGEDNHELDAYKNNESTIIHLTNMFIRKHFEPNSYFYKYYFSMNFDINYYENIGIDLNFVLKTSNNNLEKDFSFDNYSDYILKNFSYEEKLKLYEYILMIVELDPNNANLINDIKAITLSLKCKKSDVLNLLNKYKVVFK